MSDMKKVTVLLSTYNGERFLEEQIDSLIKQRGVQVNILVRDDGSSDGTISILERYKKTGVLDYVIGKNCGPALSFFNLVKMAPESDYYAFCDQDDYWLDDKLAIGVNELEKIDGDTPALYHGAPRPTDADLNYLKESKAIKENYDSFESCLITSACTGCTMIMNDCLIKLLKQMDPQYVIMHDAWIHKACLFVGGRAVSDPDVHIKYRQHGNNTIGTATGPFNRIKRWVRSQFKRKYYRSLQVADVSRCCSSLMSEDKKAICDVIADYRTNRKHKRKLFFGRKVKTKYHFRNFMFKMAVLLSRY